MVSLVIALPLCLLPGRFDLVILLFKIPHQVEPTYLHLLQKLLRVRCKQWPQARCPPSLYSSCSGLLGDTLPRANVCFAHLLTSLCIHQSGRCLREGQA